MMRYAQVRELDISNGEGVGVSIFVQGCHFHCKNCFNPETWDFSAGEEWTSETKQKFIKLIDRTYINRISILGGEPLAKENLEGVLDLVNETHISFPQKNIWLYTGYQTMDIIDGLWILESNIVSEPTELISGINDIKKRSEIISQCDVLVDGRYIDSQKDITLSWRGSANQRVIDIQKTLQQKKVILWCN